MSPSPKPSSGSRRRDRGSSSNGGGPPRRARGPEPSPLTPLENPPEVASFEEWDLGDDIQASIRDMGITVPTPIQALAIGEVLAGRDVIAKAETGTGKTLAFGAPLMARIDPARSSVLGLVLSPTRELSEQVFNVLKILGEARGVKVALVVGGEPLHPQVRELQAGAQVVVATPGRVIDLMGQGFLSFPWTEFVVLDEADKMLEIGFIDDVRKILEATDPDIRQTLLFSATFPPALLNLAREHTKTPAEIATASGIATVDTIEQFFLRMGEEDAPRALAMIIEGSAPEDIFLIFCHRRTDVDRLMRRMERLRYSIKALHGGYDQAARFRVMSAFRTGEVKALVATDVASRGLDVQHVTHVINVGVPRDASDYTHRIGRTGRAGRKGVALTLVAPSEERKWKPLLRQVPWGIAELESPRALRAVGRGDVPSPAAAPTADAERERPRRTEQASDESRTRRRSPDRGPDAPQARAEERPRHAAQEQEEHPRRAPRAASQPRADLSTRADAESGAAAETRRPRRERTRSPRRPEEGEGPRTQDTARPAREEAAPRRGRRSAEGTPEASAEERRQREASAEERRPRESPTEERRPRESSVEERRQREASADERRRPEASAQEQRQPEASAQERPRREERGRERPQREAPAENRPERESRARDSRRGEVPGEAAAEQRPRRRRNQRDEPQPASERPRSSSPSQQRPSGEQPPENRRPARQQSDPRRAEVASGFARGIDLEPSAPEPARRGNVEPEDAPRSRRSTPADSGPSEGGASSFGTGI